MLAKSLSVQKFSTHIHYITLRFGTMITTIYYYVTVRLALFDFVWVVRLCVYRCENILFAQVPLHTDVIIAHTIRFMLGWGWGVVLMVKIRK